MTPFYSDDGERLIETIRFRNDTATRRRLMVPESFVHPAKGQLGMWATMIERYSQPGDLVLDPMAGSGATLLAALMGRNVVCVELEQHFVEPMRRSWEKMRTMPMLGCEMGQAVILRGDARALPLPDASVGTAITSPPYEGSIQGDAPDAARARKAERYAKGEFASVRPDVFSSKKNIGTNATFGGYTRKPVDAIVTSPPYEGSAAEGPSGIDWTKQADGRKKQEPHGVGAHPWGYTRPQVDAIVTSPPFEKQDTSAHSGVLEPMLHTMGRANRNGTGHESAENVGNQRGAAYWDSMRQVYAECWRVLKPGGLMALVVKGFTRAGEYVDLPGQTEALLLEAGWQKHDHWRRELWSLSFWRILQKRRDPAAFDNRLMYEEVLAFRKGA